MRIALDLRHIGETGGVERFSARLVHWLCSRGHSVTGFTYAGESAPVRFRLPSELSLVHYDFSGEQESIGPLRKRLLACRPDVFLSPSSYNNTLLWCAVLQTTGIPLIYSERSNPDVIERERWNWKERRAVLWAADAVHLLLPGYMDSVPRALRHKVRTIPNPLGLDPAPHSSHPKTRRVLLSLGRLDPVKQIPLLAKAFALLAKDFPKWDLPIWGQGTDQRKIRGVVRRNRLEERIFLPGLSRNPQEQYAAADIFCIPSRYEGFPNTVIEAMAHGLPVIGFADCTGVNSLVRHGVTGLLAREMTADSLAESLRSVMADADQRERMGLAALECAKDFAPEIIFQQWEELLRDVSQSAQGNLTNFPNVSTEDEEETVWQATLQRTLARKNVLLREWQLARRFLRRYPPLKKMLNLLLHK